MKILPPLRIPRGLLDPRASQLPAADADGLVKVVLEHDEGQITAIHAVGEPAPAAPLALTPLVEPHAHLDKAYSAAAFPNREGTMAGAMAANRREAEGRTAQLVELRAERALQNAERHGLRAIRSHVDSLGPWTEPSWEALESLRRKWIARLELQLVALVPIRHWLTGAGHALARRVANAGGVLGGVIGLPYGNGVEDGEAVLTLLQLAESLGCGIDLHVDEADRDPGRGVALVTRLMRHHRIMVPVVCSHACSMALLRDRPCRQLADSMAAAGIGVVALPTTNLWLLGRRPGMTPSFRAQAPIRQLQAAGVTVAVGGDNVQDPWYPGGNFDPIELLRVCSVASHLHPWLRQGLSPFTTAAARLLGLPWDGVLRVGSPADLLVLGAGSWNDLLAASPHRRVLRAGVWLPPPEQEEASPLLASLRGFPDADLQAA